MFHFLKREKKKPSKAHKIMMDAIQYQRKSAENVLLKIGEIHIERRHQNFSIPFEADRRFRGV